MESLKQFTKRFLLRLAPHAAASILAARSRRIIERRERQRGLPQLSAGLVQEHGLQVKGGPFEGLHLPEEMVHRHIGPFLAGTYEATLHHCMDRFKEREYQVVVDIGSSFGYYAVGLARLFPYSTVYAFDTDPWARRLTRQTAKANGCENVQVFGICDSGRLQHLIRDQISLVVSDCEGCERELLTSIPPRDFEGSDLIVEIHPPGNRRVLEEVADHFERTHNLESRRHIEQASAPGFPVEALREYRNPRQEWLIVESGA